MYQYNPSRPPPLVHPNHFDFFCGERPVPSWPVVLPCSSPSRRRDHNHANDDQPRRDDYTLDSGRLGFGGRGCLNSAKAPRFTNKGLCIDWDE